MKKIVCHITSAHPANDIRIFHKECVSLVENGYEVHLVAAGSLEQDEKGVNHHSLTLYLKKFRLLKMMIRSFRAYRLATTTGARVFHIHDPELLPFALLLKWQGNTVIYDAHEDLPRDVMMKDWIPYPFRKTIAWLVEKMENFIARRLDWVISATPFIHKRFQEMGANTLEVMNYPKLGEFDSGSSAVSENVNIPKICYVGMISLQRGILELINSIEAMNVSLIIAGAFVDRKTEKMARALPGWKKVDFRGFVSRHEIANIFKQSLAGVCLFHPTAAHHNALPNKLFEYMSSGIPVIVSNFASWISIIDKAQCGLCVDPKSVFAIKDAIQWILDNPLTAKKMGEKGKFAVAEYYNWKSESDKLLRIYQYAFDNTSE